MMTNLDLPVSYAFKAKDATKVCFHTNKHIACTYRMQERNVVKLCSRTYASWYEDNYIVIRFFLKPFKIIRPVEWERNRRMAKDARQMCPITHKYLPTLWEPSRPWGLQRLARETDSLPYFSWSLWTITTLQSALLPKTSPGEAGSCRKIKDMLSDNE